LEYSSLYYETLSQRLQIALDRIFLPHSPYDAAAELHQCAEDVNLQIRQQIMAASPR
jgi:hypothetical protein